MKFKYLFILILLQINIFATTLLTYNTYNRSDRVDLMLSFDTPYSGKIFLKQNHNNFAITLTNVDFDKTVTKNLNSNIVQQIQIVPDKNNIKIIINSQKNIGIIASKTTDGFGLRIRATPLVQKQSNKTNIQKQSILSQKQFSNNLQTDQTIYGNTRYYLVLIILLFLVLVLFFVKKKVAKQSSGNWLFKSNSGENHIKIVYRKPIDTKNSAVVLEYQNRRYLVITGSSNQLLDKFTSEGNIQDDNEEDFEQIFAKNREKLDEFLKVGNDKLSNYKNKASKDIDEL